MLNPLKLTPGQQYRVVQAFTDYDQIVHPIGETWIFSTTRFLPYEDGLTLHVTVPGMSKELMYRFQWRPEEQAGIIENFLRFVSPVKEL